MHRNLKSLKYEMKLQCDTLHNMNREVINDYSIFTFLLLYKFIISL